MPDFSVIIANYNSGDMLQAAVASAISQQNVDVEIVVSDDCSSDGSVDRMLERFAFDTRLKAVRARINGGPSKARNLALEIASGEYIAILDADDLFLQGRLSVLLEVARRTRADIVADNLLIRGRGMDSVAFTEALERERVMGLGELIVRDTPWETADTKIGYLKPIIRRSFLVTHGIRYDEERRIGEDYQLLFKLLLKGAVFVVHPSPGYVAVEQDRSLSRGDSEVTSRILELHDAIVADAPGLTRSERALMRRRRSALSLEVALQRLRARRFAEAIARLSQVTPDYALGRVRDIARKRRLLGGGVRR